MSNIFWEGFSKQAGLLGTTMDDLAGHLGTLKGHAKDLLEKAKPSADTVKKMRDAGGQTHQDIVEGVQKGVKNYTTKQTEELLGHAGKAVGKATQKLKPDNLWGHLQDLGDHLGISKKPKSTLERIGKTVKEHPVASTGIAAGGLGLAGYGASQIGKKKEPESYQYYNPYV